MRYLKRIPLAAICLGLLAPNCFAADKMSGMSNLVLTRIFGGVMIAIGFYMLLKKV